jgi:hypothetical protein
LIVARYFALSSAIEELDAEREALWADGRAGQEHGGEEGLLFEAKTDKGN